LDQLFSKMSRRVVSLVALVPMLFHSIFGCCWHHEHSFASHGHDNSVAVQAAIAVSPDHEHGEHSRCLTHSHGERHPDNHPTGLPCSEESCVFSVPSPTVAPQNINEEASVFVSYTVIDLSDVLRARVVSWNGLLHHLLPDSGGERCALTQVWLL
jgi:hypothetical protein